MIGYCVPVLPQLASYRLRVQIPSKHLGMPHRIGVGEPTFFFKSGNPDLAKRLDCPIVYDVVNPHFADADVRQMCDLATVITCSSEAMRWAVHKVTGRDAVVIVDPYENAESAPRVGDSLLWFGHQANLDSLKPYEDLDPVMCSGEAWSREREDADLSAAGLVLLTGNNPGASANRPAKALRAGRFVVAPEDCPHAWKELGDYIWIGDVREGVHWARENREEACRKVLEGQRFVKERFSPQLIGSQWADLFAWTLGRGTNTKMAGSASISR